MKINVSIRQITEPELKAKAVEEILLDLPNWFGILESTNKYIEDSKQLPLWLASVGEEPVGFVTLTQSSEDCAELHCMGVKMKYHHQGIGTLLYKELEQYVKKLWYIQVKSICPSRLGKNGRPITLIKHNKKTLFHHIDEQGLFLCFLGSKSLLFSFFLRREKAQCSLDGFAVKSALC